jgi:hypothetical protein
MSRSKKADLKALQDLVATRGWAIVRDVMEREIVTAAMAIADNPNMTIDEINFRRGAIWAGKQLTDVPTRLTRILETDIRIDESMTSKPLGTTPDDAAT